MDFGDILDIISVASFSVFGIVVWGLVCGIAALALSLTAMLIFRKKIMIKRAHGVLKVLAVSWFVLVPLASGYFWFKWGMADATEEAICENGQKLSKEINSVFNAGLRSACSDIVGENALEQNMHLSPNDMTDLLGKKVYEQYCQTLEKSSANRGVGAKLTAFFLKISRSEAVSFVIRKSIRKLLEKTLRLENNYTKAMMSKKLDELFNGNIFSEILMAQVKHFFRGIKKSILLMFFIILLFPVLEIGIAHWLEFRKKERKQEF